MTRLKNLRILFPRVLFYRLFFLELLKHVTNILTYSITLFTTAVAPILPNGSKSSSARHGSKDFMELNTIQKKKTVLLIRNKKKHKQNNSTHNDLVK